MGKKIKKLIKATKEDQVLLNSLSGIITEEHEEGVIVQADQYVFTQLEKRFEVIRSIKQEIGETPVTISKSEKKIAEEQIKSEKIDAAKASIENGKAEKEKATKDAKKVERKDKKKVKVEETESKETDEVVFENTPEEKTKESSE